MNHKFILLLLVNIQAFTFCLGNSVDSLLTLEEKKWIDQNKNNLRFAPDPNWIPVDYVDSEGVHLGITAELVKIIENKLDISFNLVYLNAWADGLHEMRNNQVDVMGSVQRTEERERYLNFTDPYIIIPIVILVRNNYSYEVSPEQINNMRLSAVRDYAYVEYVNNTYPGAETIEYEDNLTALVQTSLGNTDGVIIDLMSASALVEKHNIANLNIGKTLEYSLELRFASRKDLPELNSILQKTLASIDESQKQEIIGRWVNIQSIDPDNFLKRHYKYLIYFGILLLIVSIAIFYINYLLRKKVLQRTQELTREVHEKNIALEKARESDELKSSFLNNLSHEIRTPMNAIVGFSSLLQSKKLTNDQIDHYTSVIDSSADQLLKIVDDVLDMALIESRQVIINKEVFNLHNLMETLYDRFVLEANKIGIDLKLIMPSNKIMHLYSDQTKLRQVLTNILDNAFKFTSKGQIVFGYEVAGKNIRFFVKDTGFGIPENLHQKIFERFFKVEMPDNSFMVGSGLGLPISKSLTELLGGDVWVESSGKDGTELCFTIPINDEIAVAKSDRVHRQDHVQQSHEYDFSDITILIAEDDMYNQMYFEEILSQTNAWIIMAMNGKEAIDYINENPDIKIALLDIRMPGMDGLEVAREIRKKSRNIVLIAQTAYSQEQEREIAIQAGFDEFISKPINREEILRLIKYYITNN